MHVNDMQEAQQEVLNQNDQLAQAQGSARTAPNVAMPKSEFEPSSDEEDSSMEESENLDTEEREEKKIQQDAQEAVAVVYNYDSKKEDIDYQRYQFSVAQKYDLTTRRLTYKKIKYIADEIFLELQWRMRRTLQWQISMFFILFIFFLRMFIHYTGQYLAL